MMKPSLATFLSEVINLQSMVEGAELVGGYDKITFANPFRLVAHWDCGLDGGYFRWPKRSLQLLCQSSRR